MLLLSNVIVAPLALPCHVPPLSHRPPCRYAADVADLIAGATSGQVAGFIAETIQGVGGAVQLADGYLPAVHKVGMQSRFLLSKVCLMTQC